MQNGFICLQYWALFCLIVVFTHRDHEHVDTESAVVLSGDASALDREGLKVQAKIADVWKENNIFLHIFKQLCISS